MFLLTMPQGAEPQGVLECVGIRVDDYTKLTEKDFKKLARVQLTYSSRCAPFVTVFDKKDDVCAAIPVEGVCMHKHYLIPQSIVRQAAADAIIQKTLFPF